MSNNGKYAALSTLGLGLMQWGASHQDRELRARQMQNEQARNDRLDKLTEKQFEWSKDRAVVEDKFKEEQLKITEMNAKATQANAAAATLNAESTLAGKGLMRGPDGAIGAADEGTFEAAFLMEHGFKPGEVDPTSSGGKDTGYVQEANYILGDILQKRTDTVVSEISENPEGEMAQKFTKAFEATDPKLPEQERVSKALESVVDVRGAKTEALSAVHKGHGTQRTIDMTEDQYEGKVQKLMETYITNTLGTNAMTGRVTPAQLNQARAWAEQQLAAEGGVQTPGQGGGGGDFVGNIRNRLIGQAGG